MNLVSDAVKFTESGGVVVTATFLPEGLEGKPAIRVEVHDTGIGIPPEKLDRLCDPFYQVDGSASRGQGGTGLGLAIVHAIVEQHHGDIRIESQPGQGTTVTLLLPLVEQVSIAKQPESASLAAAPSLGEARGGPGVASADVGSS